MIQNQKGYTFVELMATLVIMGLLAAGTMSAFRSFSITAAGRMTQVAMGNLAAQAPNGKYPTSVTLTDLKTNGAGAILEDYVINSYARMGTPLGADYKLELTAPDETTLLCITETTLIREACS